MYESHSVRGQMMLINEFHCPVGGHIEMSEENFSRCCLMWAVSQYDINIRSLNSTVS